MRFSAFIVRLPIVAALATASLAVGPLYAQDQEIVFGPGTGDAQYADPEYADRADRYADAPDDDANSSIDDIADKMSDPATQYGLAAGVERATEAMMNVPVGPFASAIERARPGTVDRRLPRDARLGDLAGRDAAYLPQELGARTGEMVAMMGGVAKAMASMMPEFERMSREVEESFRTARQQARR